MIGTTLSDIRRHIESLATPTGDYYLVCGRTGDRPVPGDGLYFECRATARAAATATEQYRTALRRYDPQLPCYDVIVCEQTDGFRPAEPHRVAPTDEAAREDGGDRADGAAPPTGALTRPDEQSLVDFCHSVAGVVFETIADSDHAGVQEAIMDRYLAAAETVEHPDELCLQLLGSIAAELDDRLTADEGADLLRTAASRLPEPTSHGAGTDPFESTLASLEAASLLSDYRIDRQSTGCAATTWAVTVTGYRLDTGPDRLVTLPLVVELFRRLSTVALQITGVERIETQPSADRPAEQPASWRLTLTASPARTSGPLSVVEEGRP